MWMAQHGDTNAMGQDCCNPSGDYENASLLGTAIGEHAFIVFGHNNPDHFSNCKELGFGAKKSIKPICVLRDMFIRE